ncbi:DUF4434 domain-containing protein [Candidatus Sumerlaeota bacterium]|nr:DUF4434 domain-containing protein [Candidatus Sumerlaeota bacterium]
MKWFVKFCIGMIFLQITAVSGIAEPPKIEGAFLWVMGESASWSRERWSQELAWMRNLQMDTIIVSATVSETPDGNTAIYPSSRKELKQAGRQPLEKILAEADENNMSVYLGLVHTRRWWSETSEAFLAELAQASIQTATELYNLYSSHKSLKGFYITQEIDNLTWVNEEVRQRLVKKFLKPVSDHIKRLNASLIVCEAPFYNVIFQKPKEYGEWWDKTLAEVPNLDLLIPQDGIGVHHAKIPDVVEYFTALKKVCNKHKRTLWADLEVFESGKAGGSKPAEIERIAEQIKTEAPLVEKIVCWEFLTYLSPCNSKNSLDLYIAYLNYLNGNKPLGIISRGCKYRVTPAPLDRFPDDGVKLTDGIARKLSEDQVGWRSKSPIMVTLDLGKVRSALYNFRATIFHSRNEKSALPTEVKVAVSKDAKDFVSLGKMEPLGYGVDTLYTYNLLIPRGVSARYVRFEFLAPEQLLLCSELSIYSTEFTKPKILATPRLLSEGKEYFYSKEPSSIYSDENRKLTDNAAPFSWGGQVGWESPESDITVTIDLKEQCVIKKVEAYFMRSDASAVSLPESVKVQISADGKTYKDFATLGSLSSNNEAINKFFGSGSGQGRFVKVIVTPQKGWLMLSEIKVFGHIAE